MNCLGIVRHEASAQDEDPHAVRKQKTDMYVMLWKPFEPSGLTIDLLHDTRLRFAAISQLTIGWICLFHRAGVHRSGSTICLV